MFKVEPVKAPPFEFQTPDGGTYALPAFSSLPVPVLEEFERSIAERPTHRTIFDPFAQAFIDLLREHAPEVADKLAAEQVVALTRAYFEDARGSGATVGESSGSSD